MMSTTQYFLPQLACRRAWDGMVRDGGHHSRQARKERKGKRIFSALLNLLVKSDSCSVLIIPVTLVEDAYLREGLLNC